MLENQIEEDDLVDVELLPYEVAPAAKITLKCRSTADYQVE